MLTILVESDAGTLQFGSPDSPESIPAMFNPSSLSLSRTVKWEDQKAAKRDNSEMQFTGSDPQTFNIDLLFDTYDSPKPEDQKDSVKKLYTSRLLKLTMVQGKKHRPPVCQLHWGQFGTFFQGVLQQLDTKYTMFTSVGVPVRATVHCVFKQWITNGKDLKNQELESSDVAKVWVVKRGQSLATIAALEYGDPRAWQAIADANGIDDPLQLVPGTQLLLPARRVPWNPNVS